MQEKGQINRKKAPRIVNCHILQKTKFIYRILPNKKAKLKLELNYN